MRKEAVKHFRTLLEKQRLLYLDDASNVRRLVEERRLEPRGLELVMRLTV